jgi:hypothetical protein
MNSTISTNLSIKTKIEKSNPDDVDGSEIIKNNRSNISDNQNKRKTSSAEKLNKNEDRKLSNTVNLNNSNVATAVSPLKRKQTNRKGKKRRVVFSKNWLDVVHVESYKKYNIDVSTNEPETNNIVRCKCLIF